MDAAGLSRWGSMRAAGWVCLGPSKAPFLSRARSPAVRAAPPLVRVLGAGPAGTRG